MRVYNRLADGGIGVRVGVAAVVMVGVTMLTAMTYANQTNRWEFDVPGDYEESDETLIRANPADDGRAELILQAQDLGSTTFSNYFGWTRSGIADGEPAGMRLTRADDGSYNFPGIYRSRVFDKGVADAWWLIMADVDNSVFPFQNLKGEISVDHPGLVALYHLNNDNFLDQVSGTTASHVGLAPIWTEHSILGSHASFFNQNRYVRTVNPTLLQHATAFTISAWVRAQGIQANNAGVVYAFWPQGDAAIFMGTDNRPVLRAQIGNNALFLAGNSLVPDIWTQVTVTWSGSVGRGAIYMNGELVNSASSSNVRGTLGQSQPFIIGRSLRNQISLVGWIDEVAIWDRELSAAEVSDLYSALSAVDFRVRSGSTPELTGPFVGPDGTTGTAYLPGGRELQASDFFDPFHRYMQYEAEIFANATGADTPYLNAVRLETTDGVVEYDSTLAQLEQAASATLLTNYPGRHATPYLGLRRAGTGAYATSGTYQSPIMDGGEGASWQRIAWEMPSELATDTDGLNGLWRLNGSWAAAIGGVIGQSQGGASFTTTIPKLGSGAARFDGIDGQTTFALNHSLRSLEFWMFSEQPNGGILELNANNNALALRTQEGVLRLSGTAAGGAILYVNGATRARELQPGWNHVQIVLDSDLSVSDMVLGVAGGNYWAGLVDEIAIFDHARLRADAVARTVSGIRQAGGRARARIRFGNDLPLTSGFSGNYQSGQLIGVSGQRYFQYELELSGGGLMTPAVRNVRVESSAGIFALRSRRDFLAGTFGANAYWYGDLMGLVDQADRGPVSLTPLGQTGLEALWAMDEATWQETGAQVMDSAGARHGAPVGAVDTESAGGLGLASGRFGAGNYVALSAVSLPADFTVSFWFRSGSASRAAMLATAETGGRSYAIELNGNGSGNAPGRVSFVVTGGSGSTTVSSRRNDFNDNRWHHVAAIRRGQQLHLYVDGVRENTATAAGLIEDYGAGSLFFGRYGSQAIYYDGLLDDVSIWSRALSEAEIGRVAQAGFEAARTATLESTVLDAGGRSIWQTLDWVTDAPYGVATPRAGANVVGLWTFDEAGGQLLDHSNNGHHGSPFGTIDTGVEGVYSNAWHFQAPGAYVTVPHHASLSPNTFTLSAWVSPEAINGRTIVEKRSGGQGYALGFNPSGHPVVWLSGTTLTAPMPVPQSIWTHLAATYDGTFLTLYVNGLPQNRVQPAGVVVATAADLRIGRDAGTGFYGGRMDHVALLNTALNPVAMLAQYRAGVGRLRFQIRTGNDPDLSRATYIGPDGTPATWFTRGEADNLLSVADLSQYIQFRGELRSEDARFTPRLYGVRVLTSRYPDNAPWIAVADAAAYHFPGNLVGFQHQRTAETNTMVRYQITGDTGPGARWFFYDTGAARWAVETNAYDTYPLQTSTRDVVNAHIGKFYSQVYDKTGGDFRFKAFLKSGGEQQVAVDWVEVAASSGRITVLSPNGEERGDDALIATIPYAITWSWTGTVSSAVAIEFSNTGPNGPWYTITTSAPVGADGQGSYMWTTPSTIGPNQVVHEPNMYVRVRDPNDPTISDRSDSAFELVRRFKVLSPNGGEVWYIGQPHDITWLSSYNMGGLAQLHYAPDGVNFNVNNGGHEIAFATGNIDSSSNTYAWTIPADNADLLSSSGKVRVQRTTGEFADTSDEPFTVAGIVITDPVPGQRIKRGEPHTVRWKSVLGGAAVAIDFSSDGGNTFTNISNGVVNSDGMNAWPWAVDEGGTDTAMLRIRSMTDTNVVAHSPVFTVADIEVLAPSGLEVWLAGSQQTIRWLAGGAGDTVNIFYRITPDEPWAPIAMNSPNALAYEWTVSERVSTRARVLIQSVVDTNLTAMSAGDFNIAGVRVRYPNSQADSVVKGQQFYILHDAAPETWSGARIEISYGPDRPWESPGPLSTNWSLGGPFPYTPTTPSRQAKVRVSVNDSPGYDNVSDDSDDFFTVAGILMEQPEQDALYTIGTQNPIQWLSAGAGAVANIYYAPGGNTNDMVLLTPNGVINNQIYPGRNPFNWTVPETISPSVGARIVVQSAGFSDVSAPFTVRGIRFVDPAAETVWDVGAEQRPAWAVAALDASARATIDLSLDGGATYTQTLAEEHPLVGQPFLMWNIPADQQPTTEARLRLTVTTSDVAADVGMVARSEIFTLRGLRVEAPADGDVWHLGSEQEIRFISAAMGDTFNIEYSSDDGATFDSTPVAQGLTLGDGEHTVAWPVELNRRPSADARIRVSASGGASLSQVFTLAGIRVDRPMGLDIWAAGEANMIRWVGVGTSDRYDIELLYPTGTPPFPVAQNVSGPELSWMVPPQAIPDGDEATNVVMRVRDRLDGALLGDSEPFVLVDQPRIRIEEPRANEFLKVGQQRHIRWIRGGQLNAEDFRVFFQYGDNFALLDEIDGTVTYDPDSNLFSIPWGVNGVPDAIGQARVMVSNTVNAAVTDTSSIFTIVPNFTVVYPNGAAGEDPIYANQRVNVSWTTWGSADRVNLYYRRNNEPWTLIAADVPNNSTVPPSAPAFTLYEWHVPNFEAENMRFRVEDARFAELGPFDGVTPGPYDDSDNTFRLNFFTVRWQVGYDDPETGERKWLDKLSVSDSSGWSASNLSSVDADGNAQYIERRYPFGRFDTVWSRQFFNDTVEFQWMSNSNQTRTVIMKPSDTEPDAQVYGNFSYETVNDTLTVHTWIARGGQILINPDRSRVYLYDTGGNMVEMKASGPDQPLTDGFFRIQWENITQHDAFTRGNTYFARVEVDYSGVTYSAAVTYRISLSGDADQELLEAIAGDLQNLESTLTNQITGVSEQVGGVSDQVTGVQAGVDQANQSLGEIQESTDRIEAGVGDISTDLAETVIPGIESILGEVEVLDGEMTMAELMEDIYDNTAADQARILNRPTTVEFGSTNSILYKAAPNYDFGTVRLRVEEAPQVLTMREVSPGLGIYQVTLIANWGLGPYTISVTDPNASDRMIIEVVPTGASDMQSVLATIEELGTQVATVSQVLTGTAPGEGIAAMLQQLDAQLGAVRDRIAADPSAPLDDAIAQIEGILVSGGVSEQVMTSLDSLDRDISTISSRTTSAEQAAQQARSAAQDALTAIQLLREEMLGGFAVEATDRLAEIRGALQTTHESIVDIPRALGIDMLRSQLAGVADQVSELARREGLEFDVDLAQFGPVVGDGVEEDTIDQINTQVLEIRSSMEFLRELIERQSDEPVIVEDWMGM